MHLFQSTTVVSYRPILADKPLSCNLNHCEMFSCILGMEDETALSIIDPVTVNMEVTCRPHNVTTRGIADAIISPSDRVLEVSSPVKRNLICFISLLQILLFLLNCHIIVLWQKAKVAV